MPIDTALPTVADDATAVRVMAMNMTALLTAEAYVGMSSRGQGLARFTNQPLKGCTLASLPRPLAKRKV